MTTAVTAERRPTVLLIAATKPARIALESGTAKLAEAGALVEVATYRDQQADLRGLPLREVRIMRPRGWSDPRPRRFSPRYFAAKFRTVLIKLLSRRKNLSLKTWVAAKYDPWMRTHAAGADMIVALDRYAIYTVWRLRRRNRRAALLHGLDAAVSRILDG